MSDIDAAVRAGVAVYNAGHYHAAHDAWEDEWLALESGTSDEQFLHGLIQFTAAVHHGHEANWAPLRSLAGSAGEYLADLPERYRCVDVGAVRSYLAALAADPVHLERAGPPALTCDGRRLEPPDLDLEAALAAAPPLAEATDLDETPVETAVAYARTDLDAGDEGSQFVTLVWDFVRETDRRALVHQRLGEHVERRRAREEDVEGLFE